MLRSQRSAAKMASGVAVDFDSFLLRFSSKFTKAEQAYLIRESKQRLFGEYGSLPEDNLYPLLKKLQKHGRIKEGETSLLEYFYAEKTSNKQDVKQMMEEYKATAIPKKQSIVGRDEDIKELLEHFNNEFGCGVNLFGISGVGKTTLAQEVAKQFCESSSNDFEKLTSDLRGMKDLRNVYSSILDCFKLSSWDYDRNRILSYLKVKEPPKSTLLVLDNVEQILCKDPCREEFIGFISQMLDSQAAKNGTFKIILTSTVKVKDSRLETKGLSDFFVKPFEENVSSTFITERGSLTIFTVQEHMTLLAIADLCRNIPYLLEGFAQMIREGSSTLQEMLMKVEDQLSRDEVPKQFAIINLIFESLPSEDIKQVAVKVAIFCRPFSVSAAQKIANLPSVTDTHFDLEILAGHKLLTAIDSENKSAERMYDIHAIFREFVKFICDDSRSTEGYRSTETYKLVEAHKDSETQFFIHFTEKLIRSSKRLEKYFIEVYKELDVDRPNYELTFDIASRKDMMGFLHYSDEYYSYAQMSIVLEGLESAAKRRKLYHNWAEIAEQEGNCLTSAQLRCWESIQEASLAGPHNAMQIISKAKESLTKAKSTATSERYEATQGLYLYCLGNAHLMIGESTEDKKDKKDSLEQAISELEQSLDIRRRQLGDHTLTARTLSLIGNYYMAINKPNKAEKIYREAMNMKIKLVGSDLHWEIPTYYNQMAAVNEIFGTIACEEDRSFANLSHKAKAHYNKAKEWIEKAIDLQEKLGVGETQHTATFQRNLANILLALGENDKALENAKKSYERRKEQLGTHPETVRIMYLIGIINEWRRDKKQALEFYDKAFVMEESLPYNNHSVVRPKIRERLLEICSTTKRAGYEAKFKEISDREKRKLDESVMAPEDSSSGMLAEKEIITSPKEKTETRIKAQVKKETKGDEEKKLGDLRVDDLEPGKEKEQKADFQQSETEAADLDTFDKFRSTRVQISQQGGYFDLSEYGVHLQVSPEAVDQTVDVTCSVHSSQSIPTPVSDGETLVSNIIELGPVSTELHEPVVVTILHSAAMRDPGYELVVKELDKDGNNWKMSTRAIVEPASSIGEGADNVSSLRAPYICIELWEFTTLAVVTRLITDTFQVDGNGAVIQSSVCPEVLVEFPRGAVKRRCNGKLKVQMIPEVLKKDFNASAFPFIFLDGFDGQTFYKPVIIKVPHPCPDKQPSGEIRLLCLENIKKGYPKWTDITDTVSIEKQGASLVFSVTHFTGFSAWICNTYSSLLDTAWCLYQKIRFAPRTISFSAYKRKGDIEPSFLMRLVCVVQHRQDEILQKMKGQSFLELGMTTADDAMRPGDKAYLQLEGDLETTLEEEYPFFLCFCVDAEPCIKPLEVRVKHLVMQNQAVKSRLKFFSDPKEEKIVCRLPIEVPLTQGMALRRVPGLLGSREPDINFPIRRESLIAQIPSASGAEMQALPSSPESEWVQCVSGEVVQADPLSVEGEVDPMTEGASSQAVTLHFGDEQFLLTASASLIAEKFAEFLGVDRTALDEPSTEIKAKVLCVCRNLKIIGRHDIVKHMRHTLTSGMTGPINCDEMSSVKDMPYAIRRDLTQALSGGDWWKIFASELGIHSANKLAFYERMENPAEGMLEDYLMTRNLMIGELYTVLVRCKLNALADEL